MPLAPTAGSIQSYLQDIIAFLNTVTPALFALAFLFFLWNIARYFIIEAGNEEGREKAKRYALYGLAGFVILFSFWGIINIIMQLFGIDGGTIIAPDYLAS